MLFLSTNIQSLILWNNVIRRTFKIVLPFSHFCMGQLLLKLCLSLSNFLHNFLVLLFSSFFLIFLCIFKVEDCFALCEIGTGFIFFISFFLGQFFLFLNDFLNFFQFLNDIRWHFLQFKWGYQSISPDSLNIKLAILKFIYEILLKFLNS